MTHENCGGENTMRASGRPVEGPDRRRISLQLASITDHCGIIIRKAAPMTMTGIWTCRGRRKWNTDSDDPDFPRKCERNPTTNWGLLEIIYHRIILKTDNKLWLTLKFRPIPQVLYQPPKAKLRRGSVLKPPERCLRSGRGQKFRTTCRPIGIRIFRASDVAARPG